jgi:hypothetical protein
MFFAVEEPSEHFHSVQKSHSKLENEDSKHHDFYFGFGRYRILSLPTSQYLKAVAKRLKESFQCFPSVVLTFRELSLENCNFLTINHYTACN